MNRRNKIIEISIIIESLLIKTLKMDTSEPDSEGDILLRKILGLKWDFNHINGGSINEIYHRAKKLRGDRWFIINEGEFFEGTLKQYRKRFASSADEQFIVNFCKFNKYNLGRTWEGYL